MAATVLRVYSADKEAGVKAFHNCSSEEFDKRTLAEARARFQSTWPKCFRVADLWQHAHRSAQPVE